NVSSRTDMRRARRVVVAAVGLLSWPALARGADVPGEEAVVSPEPEPAPAVQAEQPPAAPAAPAPPPAAPVAIAPPPDLEQPAAHPTAEDKWPIELVRRPLTLPGGMASFGTTLNGHRPKNHFNVDPTSGGTYTFNSDVAVG